MSTHEPGFQSHFSFFNQFVIAILATSGIRVNEKIFLTIYKHCHVVLVEYSQMSTHIPGFHSYFSFFASLC